ncbi:hypothetical protein AQUCO_01800250v1 [Aquilegia coerulea]|uniref:Uncharacterized protein n=1 Tax=Aquilegia coerulea TaxID=218851 RepID=A0A2G5DKM0_AQUCA|nr:hypothetical protein AQUCO_01800250v1 [Aquilegia coerulea]
MRNKNNKTNALPSACPLSSLILSGSNVLCNVIFGSISKKKKKIMELYHKCNTVPPTPSSDLNRRSTTSASRGYCAFRTIPSYPITIREFKIQLRSRTRVEVVQDVNTQPAKLNVKIANLFARKKERIKLPDYGDECQKLYPISKFLSQPSGLESILNTKAFEDFQFLESNTYRCILPKIKLLKFEVAPMVDLRVTPTSEDCTVEMLSCKFEGSEAVERQNDRFSAFMRNHITWNTDGLYSSVYYFASICY